MMKLFFAICLLLTAGTAMARSLTLTLPDPGTYSYWIQAKNGTVSVLPAIVSEKKTVKITEDISGGDHLFVLDSHAGGVASQIINVRLDGNPDPITIRLSDFHPILAVVAAASPAAPTAAPEDKTVPDDSSGVSVSRLLTGLVSLALAGGVLWLLVHLVKTRGQPLLLLARRAGVEVPDPTPMEPENIEATVIYTAPKRTPEAVPNEAGLPAPQTGLQALRGPEVALAGVDALVGVQGLVAGSTFALSNGDVTIGRDGENDIVLAENTVSRRHARVARDGIGQFTLIDLGSANGVYVNGTRVQRAILNSGDEIKIGDNYFRFHAAKEQLL